MGWYFNEYDDRKATIEGLIKKEEIKLVDGSGVVVRTCLAHTYKGFAFAGVLYAVYEDEMFDKERVKKWSKRWIAVHLLKYLKKQWGYKSMDESVGPYYYGCPLKYLDMVPEVTNPAWREVVRDHWANRKKVKRDSRFTSTHICPSKERKSCCSNCSSVFVIAALHPCLSVKEAPPSNVEKGAELVGLCPDCGEIGRAHV